MLTTKTNSAMQVNRYIFFKQNTDISAKRTSIMSTLQTAKVITHSIEIIDKLVSCRTADVVIGPNRRFHVTTHVEAIHRKLN